MKTGHRRTLRTISIFYPQLKAVKAFVGNRNITPGSFRICCVASPMSLLTKIADPDYRLASQRATQYIYIMVEDIIIMLQKHAEKIAEANARANRWVLV